MTCTLWAFIRRVHNYERRQKMDEMKILIPGVKKEFERFDAIIYPIAFNQIRNFTETLVTSLKIVFERLEIDQAKMDSDDKVEKDAEAKRIGMELVSLLSPIAAKDLLGIFSECVVIKSKPNEECPDGVVIPCGIQNLPHWNVAPLIVEWLKESFLGEEKIRPWIEAMKEVSSQVSKMDLNSILA